MYVFLVLAGTLFVFYGAWVRGNNLKNNTGKSIKPTDTSYNIKDSELELNKRIEALELIIKRQEESETRREMEIEAIYLTNKDSDSFDEVLQEAIKNEDAERKNELAKEIVKNTPEEQIRELSSEAERVELIRKLEKGEYSIEEVCNILGMEKGEVLLLRNIYKKYQT